MTVRPPASARVRRSGSPRWARIAFVRPADGGEASRALTDGGVDRSRETADLPDADGHGVGPDGSTGADGVSDDPSRMDGELIPRDRLTTAVDEIERRHLRPIEATTEVVAQSSTRACDVVAEQTDRTVAVSDELSSVSATIEEIAAEADQVESVTATARERTETGRSSAREAATEMAAVEEIAERAESVDDLIDQIAAANGEQSEKIDDLAEAVTALRELDAAETAGGDDTED